MFSLPSLSRFPRTGALALASTLFVVACGGGSAEVATDPIPNETSAEAAQEQASEEDPAAGQALEPTATRDASVEEPATRAGGGTITLDGVAYVFETQFCANDEDGMFNQGSGIGPDGEPFAAGIFVQPFLDGVLATAELTLGQEGIYSAPSPNRPAYETNSQRETVEFSVNGTGVSGEGPAIDLQEVALADGETVSMKFQGQCGDSPSPVIPQG